MAIYARQIDRLSACSLDADMKARTCGYWYTVASYGTPQTAFATRAEFLQWLELRRLSVAGEIPQEGEWKPLQIIGEYRRALHRYRETWESISGISTMGLDNGRYTEIRIAPDDDGVMCEHVLNVNEKTRPEFEYWQARKRCNAGQADRLLQPIEIRDLSDA